MTPHDALRVATIIGAEDIGLDKDLGSLKPESWPTLLSSARTRWMTCATPILLPMWLKTGRSTKVTA